jgi:dTDP-4-amino-4,6-dideoxygalactose transaminase
MRGSRGYRKPSLIEWLVMHDITFNRPIIIGRELQYMRKAVEAMHISGDGRFSRRCADLLKSELAVREVLLTPSCTSALEMCAILLDIKQGDEVIIPSYSFVSTVNAFVLRGARPIFADIRPDTQNIDEARLESLMTARTRAIAVVHYSGVGCEMDAIMEIAGRRGVPVVEDNAHGLFARYKDRFLGTFGSLATLSFHETKNFSCGEGGALLINDDRHVERAEIIRDKGTNRQQLFRGEVDKYTWVDIGSSYVLSDLLAAFLLAQLEERERITAKRRDLWRYYDERLRGWIEEHEVGLPVVPPHCEQAYHMYYLILPSRERRDDFIAALKNRGISSVFHYTPLHLSRMGRSCGGEQSCPVTERTSAGLVRLPFHNHLTREDQERVISEIRRFFSR